MTYRAAILHQDLVKLATISSSSYQPLLPPSYLQNTENLGLVWRTLEGVSSASLIVDFGSIVSIGAFALLNYGGGTGANFFIRGSTTDPTGMAADARSTGLIIGKFDPAFRHFIWIDQFGNTTYRYLRIDIDEPGATRLEAGGLLAGPLWKPAVSYEQGFVPSYKDQDVSLVTRAGVRYTSKRAAWREFSGRFPAISRDEYDTHLMDIGQRVRRRLPVVFMEDYESDKLSRDTIVGYIADPPAFPQGLVKYFSWPVTVMELI